MTQRTYDTTGFREIGTDQHHARTELHHNGKHYSIKGTGPEVRDILVKHAEGQDHAA